MLLTTYLPRDPEVHSWLSQELRGNEHSLRRQRKRSQLYLRWAPNPHPCNMSQGSQGNDLVARKRLPALSAGRCDPRSQATHQRILESQICSWTHCQSQFYGPVRSQWFWFEVWGHFYPKALCFPAKTINRERMVWCQDDTRAVLSFSLKNKSLSDWCTVVSASVRVPTILLLIHLPAKVPRKAAADGPKA